MRIKTALIVILFVSILLPVNVRAAEESIPTFRQEDIVPGELIVIMQEGKKVHDLSLPEKAKASPKKHQGLEKLNAGVVNVPPGEESAYISRLKKIKGVVTVEPNYIVEAAITIPNDTSYASQYAPALIQAETAWDIATGSGSITVAIIDSGIDSSHPEFAGRIVPGYDFIQDDTVPQDECGHGTHVAGIAAAAGNNAQGIAGIAWGVKIMPIRVLSDLCGGSYADVSDALIWAVDHGAKVINVSLGGSGSSTLMQNATYYAYTHGAAIFAAAGNTGGSVFYPAAYPWVMAIGSVDSSSTRVSTSNQGAALDLMAPGDSIYSTLPTNSGFFYNLTCPHPWPYGSSPCGKSTQYDLLGGTSMASPHAAGAAALLLSMPGSCFSTPDQIYQALITSAKDLGAAGFDTLYGYGLIQIQTAMGLCPSAPPAPAPLTIEYDLVSSNTCSSLTPYSWRSATVQQGSPQSSDYISIPLPAGFAFDYGGVSGYTSVNAHANGFISLGNNNTSVFTEGNYQNNSPLPGIALPNNFLAPFWDNLTHTGVPGTGIYIGTGGSAPNREFVIEYRGFEVQGTPSSSTSLTFQVVLFESSDQILYQYQTLSGSTADGSSATAGLEYGNGLGATQYSYNQSGALQNGLALLFMPFTSGAPTLPSAACPQMRAVTIEAGVASPCATSSETFDVEIASGELPYRSTLKVQQLPSAPVMPSVFLDLHHYADIHLNYSPPAPSLYPMPQVYVCYEYSAQDLLTAGGHPENLFITAHDQYTNTWSALTTVVDSPNSRLLALAPHFSFYGVATLNPQGGAANGSADSGETIKGLGLPVTGAPFDFDLVPFIVLCFAFASSAIWLIRRKVK
jgi:hypothetical protein